jgi:predicted P-loop ATPase/GTPase
LDKKDRGKTNAALPRSIRPNNTALVAIDVPGLQKKPIAAHELFYSITKGNKTEILGLSVNQIHRTNE